MWEIHEKNKGKTNISEPDVLQASSVCRFCPFLCCKANINNDHHGNYSIKWNNTTRKGKKRQQQEHFQTKRESECFCLRRGMKSTCFSNLLGCCCNTTSTTRQSDSCGDSQAQPTLFTDGKQGKITVWSEWFTVGSVSLNCYLANYSCAAGLSKKARLFYWGREDSINNNFHSLSLTSPLIKSISPTDC